ncbi:TetR/AcrR family transcriptional regulator [Bradyrhizobium sp. INPA01-394B]|uniref:TetR/AcrR family transcriptional regulator n=1 Tax=Bradyrhizobium campsiandrae TaxID=1729892 RepID=A0ABR7UE61_9BRAD|nr:TetR/AcrR family transcriptional regulator [Bradyrhizobium campsiandrae]MBC9883458.1 TetR/AcrR family transcriptional regulator [Bradyrhizobium campsiandrae]MBC9981722.1 TetR/AcrR family transcriptional regulator [Bradyrhizobium campsiandrae]
MAAAAQKPQTRRAPPRADDGEPSRAKAKHRQILDAARELFLDLGFDTTSMDAIARQAGVSKATLYVHFDDKDDLLLALVSDECRRFGPKTLWRDDGEPIDLRKGLRAIAKTFLEGFLDQRGLAMHRLIMSCASRYPRVAEVFMKAGPERCDTEVAAFLRAAQAQQLVDIPDIKLAATQFLSLIQGKEILKWALSMSKPSEAQHRALIDSGVNVFLGAYERGPAAGRQPGQQKRGRSAKTRGAR